MQRSPLVVAPIAETNAGDDRWQTTDDALLQLADVQSRYFAERKMDYDMSAEGITYSQKE